MSYLHPVTGGLTLLLLVYVATLALRSRNQRRQRAALLARHRATGPLALLLVAGSWVLGSVSVVVLRPDLSLAETYHFRIGSIMTALLLGSAFTARRMRAGDARAREVHPWLGATALLFALAQAVTGLQITP